MVGVLAGISLDMATIQLGTIATGAIFTILQDNYLPSQYINIYLDKLSHSNLNIQMMRFFQFFIQVLIVLCIQFYHNYFFQICLLSVSFLVIEGLIRFNTSNQISN